MAGTFIFNRENFPWNKHTRIYFVVNKVMKQTTYLTIIIKRITIITGLCQSSGLTACFSGLQPEFDHRLGHVEFVVDKLALRRVFFEYFSFPCRYPFHQLLQIHKSSHDQHHIFSTLTAPFHNQLKTHKKAVIIIIVSGLVTWQAILNQLVTITASEHVLLTAHSQDCEAWQDNIRNNLHSGH
jgi:hypothetical protein